MTRIIISQTAVRLPCGHEISITAQDGRSTSGTRCGRCLSLHP